MVFLPIVKTRYRLKTSPGRDDIFLMVFAKSIGYRILSMLFAWAVTGSLSTSIVLNIGYTIIYYFYEKLWEKYSYKVSYFFQK